MILPAAQLAKPDPAEKTQQLCIASQTLAQAKSRFSGACKHQNDDLENLKTP
jgi:hypothetical protein